jgi:DHA2 family multidrug resistance protein-like MFS transporter
MGAGMGLTLAPASESMIGVLPREQAGAGSAVNDTVQELGGTLGVAVIGSVVAAAFRSGIDDAVLPPTIAARARGSIADAEAAAAQAGALAHQVADVAREAFTTAMTSGFGIAAGAAFAGAALAAALLPRRGPLSNKQPPRTPRRREHAHRRRQENHHGNSDSAERALPARLGASHRG